MIPFRGLLHERLRHAHHGGLAMFAWDARSWRVLTGSSLLHLELAALPAFLF